MRAHNFFGATVLFLFLSTSCLAQGVGNRCSLAGRWYGGSQFAKYHLTVLATLTGYSVIFQGAYQNAPVETKYTGEVAWKGDRYEGGVIQLATTSASFPAPLPMILAAWSSMKMTDCDTIVTTINFFGIYTADSIWAASGAKVPFKDKLDVDILADLGVTSIVETYRRVPAECAVCPVVP